MKRYSQLPCAEEYVYCFPWSFLCGGGSITTGGNFGLFWTLKQEPRGLIASLHMLKLGLFELSTGGPSSSTIAVNAIPLRHAIP